MSMQIRKEQVEAAMTEVVGQPVEMTIRGERKFTFSTETVNYSLEESVRDFFLGAAAVNVEHDEECGSFAYVTIL